MTNTTEKMYFYEINQQTHGPINQEELIELIKAEKISYGNAIWTEGFPEWIKVEHSEFKVYISEPPPLKLTSNKSAPPIRKVVNNVENTEFNPQLISDVWVWILAISPLLIMFIGSGIIFAQCEGNEYCLSMRILTGSPLWGAIFTTIVVNTICSLLDESKLKQAGVNTKAMSNIGAWLVPAYLYQRATYLKQSFAYFIVWIISILAMTLVFSGAI